MRLAGVVLGCVGAATVFLTRDLSGQVTPLRVSSPVPLEAVSPLAAEAGAHAGYDFGLEAWSLGGQLRLPIVPGFHLVAGGDYYLRSPGSLWQLNFDAAFRLGAYGGLYGGAGLGVAHRGIGSGRAETGLDVLAGFAPPRVRRRAPRPFIEARWLLLQNRSPFAVQLGFNLPL